MCLAVPMQISEILDERKALVRQGATSLEIDISLLDEPKTGDYVIVHAGFAIETLDLEEAKERLELFRQVEEAGRGAASSSDRPSGNS
jgi:hydrogenase expression/formation protein HypC